MPITLQPFVARSFSKLHRVPHVILHLVVCILLCNTKMVDHNLQWTEVFLKNWHVSFIEPYRPTSIQQGKSFICTCRLFYTNYKNVPKMCVWNGQ